MQLSLTFASPLNTILRKLENEDQNVSINLDSCFSCIDYCWKLCDRKKAYVAKEDEELFGTWINPAYDASWIYAKVVIKPDGTWDEYSLTYSDRPIYKGEYTITDKWTDSDGYIFYKSIITRIDKESHRPYYVMSKIDKTGNVYEDLWSTIQMPTEFEQDDMLYNHRIYYRQ